MKNRLIIIICFLSFIFLSFGCKEKITEFLESRNGFVQLSRNNAEIGEKIFAHFKNMDSVKVYSVTFNKKEVTFSQTNGNKASLIVPFTDVGNEAGNFVFYCTMKTNSFLDTVLVSNQFNYKYEDFPFEPTVKWNTNEKIVQSDSWKYDGFRKNEWNITTNNDTIKFIRHYLCHDECSVNEILVFKNNGNNNLPQFLYAQFTRDEWMKQPVKITITNACKIIIDEWSGDSVYSGTFSSDNYSWVFWYKK